MVVTVEKNGRVTAPTINSYLESVSNPVGHFTALEGIFPRRDPMGRPIFRVRSYTVDFDMEWRGAHYVLRCFLSPDPAMREKARAFCAATAGLRSPFLADCIYLTGEIAVTDSLGRGTLHDVVLQRVPEGRPLHNFLCESCDNRDTIALRRLATGTAGLAGWMQQQGIAHRNIRPSGIRVDNQCTPVPLYYDFAAVGAGAEAMQDDDGPLLRFAVVVMLLAAEPELYRAMGQERMLWRPSIEALRDVLLSTRGVPDMILEAAARFYDPGAPIREMIPKLVKLDFVLPPGFASVAASQAAARLAAMPPAGASAEPAQYPVAGTDGTAATLVKDIDNRWMYIDAQGRPLGALRFEVAEEFERGRAVVSDGSRWGMIDPRGHYIIPPLYEEVTWDAEAGIAAICQDGQWGLCDSSGRQLTGLLYDWMGSMREGLLLARRDDKLGFLNNQGQVVLDFIYDSASSFGGGIAPVSIGGVNFRIDRSGRPVD